MYHVNNVIDAMMDTQPFGMFRDLMTVYVIHSHGVHDATGVGYLGTIRNDDNAAGGTTTTGTSSTTRTARIHQLALI